jgi:3',5'-cyclic-AMP phosphodiesterase
MKINLLLAFITVLSISSCRKLEYSPNQKFDKNTPTNINAANLKRIMATPGDDTIRFVLSGDSQRAYDDLSTFTDKVNATQGIDFVILNGDISDFGLLQEFKWIENYYSRLKVPYIAVIGNHDHAANGVDIYKRMYSEKLDFSFTYKGVKFVCHNTNSREYNFDGSTPDLNFLRTEFQPETGVKGYFAVAHVPPTSGDFDKKLFDEYGKILTDNGKVYAVLNAHIDKETIQYPYTPNLPVITTNSLYNRHFLVVEVVNNRFNFYDVEF